MRIVISLLFVSAVATSLLAYGPFLEPDAEAAVAASEAAPARAGAQPPVDAEAPGEAEAAVLADAAAGAEAPPAAVPGTAAEAPSKSDAAATPAPAVAEAVRDAAAQPPSSPAAAPAAKAGHLRQVSARIRGSLHATLARELDRDTAEPLGQVVNRLLVWWMDLRKDARAGDSISVVYSLPDGQEPRVHAMSYASGKYGRTFRAFSYQPEGAPYPRYYTEDGRELEERLVDSPIAVYEQVTSLLRDGRRHKGVDFKAPTGTEVYAPFDGVVQRRNWSTRRNGNCLHLRRSDGVDALFLHLDRMPADIKPGTRVRKGQLVAFVGNTGRSTAAHLHYQMQTPAGRILDPFEVHRTRRESLPKSELQRFQAEMARLSKLLGDDGTGT